MPASATSLRLTFKNVLFPTDFTEASSHALPFALAIAKAYRAKVYVTHAINPQPPLIVPLEPIPFDMDPLWQQARESLEQILDQDEVRGVVREGVLEQGELWKVLEEVIERHGIDLVVLGSHGRHGLKKLVLGSGAEQVFRRAFCPVLTVGPMADSRRTACPHFGEIIFATDFSAGSVRALPYALSLAEENQAKLTLVHFIPLVPMQHQDEVRDAATKRLRELIPADAEDWCRIECRVSFEFPAEGILSLAGERGADLIVMGVHSKAAAAVSHLPWAIAYEVVCHALCPVLTVRA
jgi:nucleotide-binding universal stress UspA family protein